MNSAKVGGTWRTIKLPYARISGNWRPIKQIYTKVGGVWKIAFDLNAADPFDGTGTIVKTPGNVLWEQVSGSWTKSGGNVSGSTTSAVAAIETGTFDGEFEIDTASTTTGGPGVGFWITDQQTWWGVRYYTEQFFFTTPGTPFYYPYNCTYYFASRPAGNVNPGNAGTPATGGSVTCGQYFEDYRETLNFGTAPCPVTSCPTCNLDSYNTFTLSGIANPSFNTCQQQYPLVLGSYGSFNITPTCRCICGTRTQYNTNAVTPGSPAVPGNNPTYNCPSIVYATGSNAYTNEASFSNTLPACDFTNSLNAFSSTLAGAFCTANPFGVGPSAGVNNPTTVPGVYKRGQLVRRSSGAFSVVNNQDFGNVGNLYARTYGNSVDFRQYSGAGRTGSASSVVTYNTGGGSRGTKHGMIVTAVPFTQTYNIGRFKANI